MPARSEALVRFRRDQEMSDLPDRDCVFTTETINHGMPFLRLFMTPDGRVVRYPGLADFVISRHDIRYQTFPGSDMLLIEIQVLGPVAALWLEFNDIIVLHASAVVVDNAAIVFLGGSGAGKSTLAASFVQRKHLLLTDDSLPVSVTPTQAVAKPGHPQLRLSPEVVDTFNIDSTAQPQAHPNGSKKRLFVGEGGVGRFCHKPVPISCIYITNHATDNEASTNIQDLTPSQAVIELVHGSFTANAAEAMGTQSRRLPRLAQIAETVPIRRLTYPSGMHHLDHIYDSIMQDLHSV